MPFNQTWANATMNVLIQSMENFGFSALYHNTGPPYSLSIDIQSELEKARLMVENNEFATDFDFQEYVQQLFQQPQDAHTRYSKPVCYSATLIQPFAFDLRIIPDANNTQDDEPRLFLISNLYTQNYKTIFPDLSTTIDNLIGQEVELLNGIEFTTEISSWGDNHETRSNHRSVRFNAAYRSYMYRSFVSYNVLPVTDLTITLKDGSTYTFPWMAKYTHGLADLSYCAAQPSTTQVTAENSPVAERKKHRLLPPSRIPVHEEPHTYVPQYLHSAALTDNRPDREVIIPPDNIYQLSCFIQTVKESDTTKAAGVSRVLVMKVTSFSPPGDNSTYAAIQFLGNAATCLATNYDMMVVDVMQNGGGYVCLGLRLIEMLVEDYALDHTKVQRHYDLPHSKLMDEYIAVVNDPNPYPDPDDVEQILDPTTQLPFVDGKAYYYPGRNVTQGGKVNWRTNNFALDCRADEALPVPDFRPSKFLPKEKLLIVSDGTCGSTCASFTKIPQEDDTATLIGVGGLWNENIDVASFAGGFVCNPSYLQAIAEATGTTFPKFLTNQNWQFAWSTWYSRKQPSRPTQFTEQNPLYREAFWGFPHASISSSVTTAMVSTLYDQVIAGGIARLATVNEANSQDNDDTCFFSDGIGYGLIAGISVIAAVLVFLLITIRVAPDMLIACMGGEPIKRSKSMDKYGVDSDQLLQA
eukprot:gene3097-3388_t